MREVGTASLADLAYEELLDAIAERRLPPGTRLFPTSLAGELGVSATPVKLAIARLASDGLVTIVARRGMFVAEFDAKQLESIFEARLFLEVGASRDSFQRVTPEFVADLDRLAREYLDLAEAGGEGLRWRLGDVDRAFHRTIVALTENDHILRWYEQANIHIQGQREVMPTERYLATIREHAAIVDAFRRGDQAGTVAALTDHLQQAKAHLLRMLQTAAMTPTVRRLRPSGVPGVSASGKNRAERAVYRQN